MRRMIVGLVVTSGFVLAGLLAAGPAQASSSSEGVAERIAAHQAEVRAKIQCKQAELRGEPCGAQTTAPAPEPQAAAQAAPAFVPERGKAIEVSISEQRLRAWEDGEAVMDTPVSTGRPGKETPTGSYEVLSKTPNHWSTIYHVDMPYAMRVVGGIFIHEVPIAPDGRRLGVEDLGRPVSAGCIRVGIGPAEKLYRWSEVGTPVIIH